MQINITYDSSVNNAPAGFQAAVQYAVGILDAAFSNNVTLNIDVGWGELDGSAITDPNTLSESFQAEAPSYTYSQIVNALSAQAALPNASPDLVAAVQTLTGLADPTNGGNFDIGRAEAKALGLLPADSTRVDGWIGFNSNQDWSVSTTATPGPNQFYLVGEVLHEITEDMGRVSSLGGLGEHAIADAWGVIDLYRFSAPGVRELAPGSTQGSTGYFSIDDGHTNLGTWNNYKPSGDFADWGNEVIGGPGPGGSDSFDNNSNPGVFNKITNTDLTLMHALGWEASQPLNIVMNGEMYYVGPGQESDNNLVIQAGGTVDVADGGTLEGKVTFDGTSALLTLEGSSAPSNVISGFVAGDTIDFSGAAIGAHPTVTLLSGNVLQIVEHNHTYDFQFDPNDDFAGQTFHVAGDGSGGTLIYIDPAAQSVTTSGPGITNGSGDLNAGHTVTFTLNMNEDVFVDTTNGTPTLSLNDGGTATYSGGSDSNALTFTYTAANGDNTPNLTVTAVNLNGGTVQDVNGHDALFNAAISNPPQGNLQIDTTPPQLTGASYSGSSWVFSFSEPVMANGTPTLDLLGRQGSYDANATAALHDPTKAVFDFSSFSPPALAAPGHELTGITDLAGNAATIDVAAVVPVNPVLAILLTFTEIAAEYAAGGHAPETANVASPFHLLT